MGGGGPGLGGGGGRVGGTMGLVNACGCPGAALLGGLSLVESEDPRVDVKRRRVPLAASGVGEALRDERVRVLVESDVPAAPRIVDRMVQCLPESARLVGAHDDRDLLGHD